MLEAEQISSNAQNCYIVGTSTKSAERLAQRAEKSCRIICADSGHPGSPFVLHPVLSAVSVPMQDYFRVFSAGKESPGSAKITQISS